MTKYKLMVCALVFCANGFSADAHRIVKVLTRNMDAGSDLKYVLGQPDIVLGTRLTLEEVITSGIPERAARLADEIAAEQPDLIALQEVTTWSTGPYGNTSVLFNQLDLLLVALANRNLHYEAVVANDLMDAQAPTVDDFSVFLRIQDRDVILAKTDRPHFSTSNPQQGQFAAMLVVPTALGPVAVPRGWSSIDVSVNEAVFHFFDTHVESLYPPSFNAALQFAQVGELIGILTASSVPVAIGGDFNANADAGPDHSGATDLVPAAGFIDAWSANHAPGSGKTWPLHDEDPSSAVMQPFERIDLIYARDIGVVDVRRVGDQLSDRTSGGFWPSDHAGVEAVLQVGR
jgi:endonuclease/exonuclease/phosphatase family metal-dependent hydrolase